MEALISSRSRLCKDMQGGVQKVWLLPYVGYSRQQIKVVNYFLSQFPLSDYYLFETLNDVGFNQQMQENEGGKFYNLSFSIDIKENLEINKFINNRFRVIGLDRLDNMRMFGLWNGLNCDSVEYKTGNSKSDFNGFTLSFSGQEMYEAPYLNSLPDTENSFLLQENGDYILQENLSKIIINA